MPAQDSWNQMVRQGHQYNGQWALGCLVWLCGLFSRCPLGSLLFLCVLI